MMCDFKISFPRALISDVASVKLSKISQKRLHGYLVKGDEHELENSYLWS